MNRYEKNYVLVNVETGDTKRVPGSFRLEKNFQVYELVDEDSQDVVLYSPTLMTYLQWIRNKVKRAVVITSGNRMLTFNDSPTVKGDINSEHITGHAVDIVVKGWSQKELAELCEKVAGYYCNIGTNYPNHVHFGIRGFHRRDFK